ncbi:response regulator [Streptomyces sp. NPDC098789]|uniref:response regulator n=1 Tax=Streptomyces sp. NPDC098789 TaxID=3366098 RepID=UPI003802C57B
MIKVVLADDEARVRACLAEVLGSAADIEVAASVPAAGAAQAVRLQAPDVVLLDICPHDTPALKAGLDTLDVRPPVCVLSARDDEEYVGFALDAGARGYVLKGDAPARAVELVRMLGAGWTMLSAPVHDPVIDHYLAARHRERREHDDCGAAAALGTLTPRERDVLVLVAEGLTNHAIAGRLHLAPAPSRTTSRSSCANSA